VLRHLLGRVLLFILGLLVTSLVIFFTLRVLPGDVTQVLGGIKATPQELETIRLAHGLDHSLASQYADWLAGLLRMNLGKSLITSAPIGDELVSKFQVTLPLCLLALVISLSIGIPLGIVSALRHDRHLGAVISFSAQSLAAVPALWAGLLLVVLFGKGVGIVGVLPSQGFPRDGWGQPGKAFTALLLPALTIGIIEGAVVLRFVRSAVLEAIPQDYVRTAAAKGLTKTKALLLHGLPNVSLAVISVIALQTAGLITGAVLVESLFNLPGVGRMLVADVGNRDLVKVQSEVLFLTGLVLLIGLLIDLSHQLVDPRQRRLTT